MKRTRTRYNNDPWRKVDKALKRVTCSADRVCAWRLITRCSFSIGLLTFHSSRDARDELHRMQSSKIESDTERNYYRVGISVKIILCTRYAGYETDESRGLTGRYEIRVKTIGSRPREFVTMGTVLWVLSWNREFGRREIRISIFDTFGKLAKVRRIFFL